MTDNKLIMVIPKSILFSNSSFQGYTSHIDNSQSFESIIKQNYAFMERNRAENNPDYKQPIAYITTINQDLKSFFAYQRAKLDDHYKERRLQGKFSIGIGGHIEQQDSLDNPILASLNREIIEELGSYKFSSPKLLGYINDDSNDVGKVHFGLHYVVYTNNQLIIPRSKEIIAGGFYTLDQITSLLDKTDMETWSRICLPVVSKLLSQP